MKIFLLFHEHLTIYKKWPSNNSQKKRWLLIPGNSSLTKMSLCKQARCTYQVTKTLNHSTQRPTKRWQGMISLYGQINLWSPQMSQVMWLRSTITIYDVPHDPHQPRQSQDGAITHIKYHQLHQTTPLNRGSTSFNSGKHCQQETHPNLQRHLTEGQ